MLNYLYYMSTKENVHNVMPLYEEIINDINNHPIWKDNKFLMGEMMIILSILIIQIQLKNCIQWGMYFIFMDKTIMIIFW